MKEEVTITRTTNETDIKASMIIYGSGRSKIDVNIGFFEHMLSAFSKHSLIDLNIKCVGDTHIDFHHSVEDCGIVIGNLLRQSIYPVSGIERYGDAVVVMDETAVQCAIDLSNRSFLVFDCPMPSQKVGDFDTELVEEFFRAVTANANISLHINLLRGKNTHHIIEAVFKSFAVAIRRALVPNNRIGIASTKGVL